MKNKINVRNKKIALGLTLSEIRSIANYTLCQRNICGKEMNIIFCSLEEIKQLNLQYLNRNKYTDVIAFEYKEDNDETIGDLFVCPAMAIKQAKERNINKKRELLLYIVHGTLHITGMKDITIKQHANISKKQNNIIKKYFSKK